MSPKYKKAFILALSEINPIAKIVYQDDEYYSSLRWKSVICLDIGPKESPDAFSIKHIKKLMALLGDVEHEPSTIQNKNVRN